MIMSDLESVAAAINKYQTSGMFHPYTCGHCPYPLRDVKPLVAEVRGDKVALVCPSCEDWVQYISTDEMHSVVALNSSIDELKQLLE